MRLIKKNIVAALEPLFEGCNMSLIEISQYDVKVSPWTAQYHKDSINDIIKILDVIQNTDLIESNFGIWRQVGYYDSTDDITMDFPINKDKLRKL